MGREILINDLLKISEDALYNFKIKFNQWNGETYPMDEYQKDPDMINNQWLFWRNKKRYFDVGQVAVCMLKLSSDTWLLTTIKKVTKELDVMEGINYEGEELDSYSQFYGRVIVKYQKKHQTQVVYLSNIIDQLEVVQVLPTIYDGEDFPGYDNVCLRHKQLETIINKNKRDWIAALENQKAVYLITDLNNGKQYVGSAYSSKGMLLSRWRNYVENGHGFNKDLKSVVNEQGMEYVEKNFQYSILENYNSRIDDQFIITRESWWKDVLGSRKFGYNNN